MVWRNQAGHCSGLGVVFTPWYRGNMRFALLTMLLVGACDGGGRTAPDAATAKDAAVVQIDAPMVDAAPDAPMIDAMVDAAPLPMNVVDACMHACDKISTCEGQAPDTTCYGECGADLGDCTAQQVMDVEACSQLTCPTDSEPIVLCLMAITCVMG